MRKTSSFITDSLQSIYQRIANLGKSMQSLSETLKNLDDTINTKVSALTDEISGLSSELKNEGKLHLETLAGIGKGISRELLKIEEGIGLQAILDLKKSLQSIHSATKDALKPENVDVLLSEALESIRLLSGETMKDEDRIQKPAATQGAAEGGAAGGGQAPTPPANPPGPGQGPGPG